MQARREVSVRGCVDCGAGGGSSKTSRGRSPSAKKQKKKNGGKAADDEENLAQCVLYGCFAGEEARATFKDVIGGISLQVDSKMRSRTCVARRRSIPKPKERMNAEQARKTTEVRFHLRDVGSGRELAEDIAPDATSSSVSDVPRGTHASGVSL